MCELCKIQDETGLNDDTILRIVKVVEEAEKAHLDHTVLSILMALGAVEVTITQEVAAEAAQKLESEGVVVAEKVASDWSSMTYVVERAREKDPENVEPPMRPLKDGEVSDDNEIAALFRALGLSF